MSDADNPYKWDTEYGIEVYRTDSNMIVIKQEDPVAEDALVMISPDRVDRLVGFLRAVREEILTDQADAAEERATGVEPARRDSEG